MLQLHDKVQVVPLLHSCEFRYAAVGDIFKRNNTYAVISRKAVYSRFSICSDALARAATGQRRAAAEHIAACCHP